MRAYSTHRSTRGTKSLMRPKGIEDLAAFSVREVKRAAAEERDEYSSAEGQ